MSVRLTAGAHAVAGEAKGSSNGMGAGSQANGHHGKLLGPASLV